MEKQVAWLEAVLLSRDIIPAMTCFHFCDGAVHAYNGMMSASMPWPELWFEASIPGSALLAVLARFKGREIKYEFDDERLALNVRAGRMRASVNAQPVYRDGTTARFKRWAAFKPEWLDALRVVTAFSGKNAVQPWSVSIMLGKGTMTATNNIVVAEVLATGLAADGQLLPTEAAEFLLSREAPPKKWLLTETHAAFQWENGVVMATQLVNGKFPDVERLLPPAKPVAGAFAITDEFREALEDVTSLMDDTNLVLAPDPDNATDAVMKATRKTGELEAGFTVGKGALPNAVGWSMQALAPAVKHADKIDFRPGPDKPCPFWGKGLRGVAAGRKV